MLVNGSSVNMQSVSLRGDVLDSVFLIETLWIQKATQKQLRSKPKKRCRCAWKSLQHYSYGYIWGVL